MKKLFILILCFCVSGYANAGKKKKSENINVNAVVSHIIDGDTFSAQVKLEDGINISVRVRILGIDAPEVKGECDREIEIANVATNRLVQLIPVGSSIELYNVKDDKYLGRIDAHVKNSQGIDVGDVLLKEKLVRKYDGAKRVSWCE